MHPAIAGLQSFGDHKGPLHLAAKRMRAAKNLKRHAIHGKAGTSTLPIVAVKRLPFQFKPLSLNPIIKKGGRLAVALTAQSSGWNLHAEVMNPFLCLNCEII